ncbi:MAG: lipopolysaccharide biosynthesis protein [Rhodospirillales bacterium]|nr:lipopolysaccharide biosynthesis protein [Rhodospirillales bacterium]MBN8897235.1 lipopolysaccharide biosynthesis protein [Rhodospirillales bacterium]MBN8905411.1 lipopolysaccharide biosynthesis protein [Rhodospirillales bacterium]
MAILSFAPAYIVPLLGTLFGIYAITRLLTPEQYGHYALVVSLMAMCQSGLFTWLDLGAKRYFERAMREGKLSVLSRTAYLGLGISTVLLTVLCFVGLGLVALPHDLVAMIWVGAAVTVAKEASTLSKVMELSSLARTRYTLMECAESLIGLAVGLSLCWHLDMGAIGILWGMFVGAAVIVLFDAPRIVARLRGGRVDLGLQKEIAAFAAPISLAFFAEYVVASADRLLVQYFLGAEDLGIYAVSYSIAERAVTAVFLALSIASYPLVVRAFERDGAKAARRQASDNAELLMTIAVPALGGFCVAAGHIAPVLVGPAFAARAAQLMPPIAIAVFLSALRAHYFSHVQHLTNRTWRLLIALAPAAVLNIALNVVLLPRIGLMGGVWASVVAYAVGLVISIVQAKREFGWPFPYRETAKAAAATLVMCVAILLMHFPPGPVGLGLLIACGALIYGVLVLALDIGRTRQKVRPMAARLRLRLANG